MTFLLRNCDSKFQILYSVYSFLFILHFYTSPGMNISIRFFTSFIILGDFYITYLCHKVLVFKNSCSNILCGEERRLGRLTGYVVLPLTL